MTFDDIQQQLDALIVPAALALVDELRRGRKLSLDKLLQLLEVAVRYPEVAEAVKAALAAAGQEEKWTSVD
ncbi:MAG: hypothetical protein ACREEI_02830 [Stellaceae bacterium]